MSLHKTLGNPDPRRHLADEFLTFALKRAPVAPKPNRPPPFGVVSPGYPAFCVLSVSSAITAEDIATWRRPAENTG